MLCVAELATYGGTPSCSPLHLRVEEHLGGLQVFVNHAAMNVGVQVSV